MAKTEEDVIEALVGSGRQAENWPRRLSDWRTKALLPELSTESLGRFGRIYWWDEDDVIDRAIIVYDQLAAFRDVDAALISIYLMGFKVERSKIRPAWVEAFGKHLAEYRKVAEQHGEEEAPYLMAERHATRTARLFGIKRSQMISALIEISALMHTANNDTASSGEALKELLEGLAKTWGLFPRSIPEPQKFDRVVCNSAEWIASLIRLAAPNSTTIELLKASADAELELACDQWQRIWAFVVKLLPLKSSSERASEERILAATLGRSMFPMLLAANSKGYASKIWRSIELAERALKETSLHSLFRDYAATGRLDADGAAMWLKLVDDVLAIWELPNFVNLFFRAEPA